MRPQNTTRGVLLVVLPSPHGPAAIAGLRPADVIMELDETPVPALRDFLAKVKQRGVAGEVRLGLLRERERLTVVAHLGASGTARKASIERSKRLPPTKRS